MCSQPQDYDFRLDPLIAKIATSLGKKFNDVRYQVSVPEDAFFISNTLFVDIATNTGNDETEKKNTVSVVVKKPSSQEEIREMLHADDQFHNEIVFYERYAKDHTEFPRCVYTEEKPPINSVIVLENVIAHRGYELCQWKNDVPLEYTVAAFREIARFHAKAYVMKVRRRDEFFDIVNDIWEVRYYPGSDLRFILNGTATRSVEYLRKQGYDSQFCDTIEAALEDTYGNVIMKAVKQEEPLATLCHGDFTANNTMFKRVNGKLKAMLIDFALLRYGSPVLDLSTFLCLHCAKQLNKDMLDHVLKVYHDSLKQYLTENGIDCGQYTYEVLYDDYKKRGLFGFFIATFFLPTMMGKTEETIEDMAKMDPSTLGARLRYCGGDEISEILANMLLNLRDIGCLDHLLR